MYVLARTHTCVQLHRLSVEGPGGRETKAAAANKGSGGNCFLLSSWEFHPEICLWASGTSQVEDTPPPNTLGLGHIQIHGC